SICAAIESLEPRRLLSVAPITDAAQSYITNTRGLTVLNNQVFFFADSYASGGVEPKFSGQLWKTDGTPKGTARVTSNLPGAFYSWALTATMGGKLYFTQEQKLSQSDGTAKGTRAISPQSSRVIKELVATSNAVYFECNASTKVGSELYC